MSTDKLAGHLHPVPIHSTSQSVADLYADLGITLRLRDVLGSRRRTAADMYCPDIRRTPITGNPPSHIDVVTTWKGLNMARAAELLFWEQTFQDCLEELIEEVLIFMFEEHLRQHKEYITQWTMVPMLVGFLSAESKRVIDLAVPDIVSDMIQKFYAGAHNLAHDWFTSTRNLPGMIYNFLRTRDCFMDSYPYPSVEVTFTHDFAFEHDRKASSMTITGDVKWFPPVIDFYNVPSALPIGAEYRIAGTYIEPVLTESFEPFVTEAEYFVESETLPLAWDSNHRCFRAIVPDVSPASSSPRATSAQATHLSTLDNPNREPATGISNRETICKLETKFFANILMRFPDNVRFETVSRYKLYLEVLPKDRSHAPLLRPTRFHNIPGPLSDDSSSGETASIHLSPPNEQRVSQDHAETATENKIPPVSYRHAQTGTSQVLPFHITPMSEGRPRQVSPKRKKPTSLPAQSTSPEANGGRLSPTHRPHSGGGVSPKRQRRLERMDSGNGMTSGSLSIPDDRDYSIHRMADEMQPTDLLMRSRRGQAPSPPAAQGLNKSRGLPRSPKACFAATSEEQLVTSPVHAPSLPHSVASSSKAHYPVTASEEQDYVWVEVSQQHYDGSPAAQRMRKYRTNYEEFKRQKHEEEERLRSPAKLRLDGARDEEDSEIANAFLDGDESSPRESSGEEYESHSDTSDPMKEETILCHRPGEEQE